MRPQGASSWRSRGACAEGAVIRMKTAAPRRVSTPPATRAPWGWALTGALLGLLLVGVLAAPARWLAAGVGRATGDMVQLAEPQGSLWNGSARLLLTGGAGSQDRAALPGRVQWRLRPGLVLNRCHRATWGRHGKGWYWGFGTSPPSAYPRRSSGSSATSTRSPSARRCGSRPSCTTSGC